MIFFSYHSSTKNAGKCYQFCLQGKEMITVSLPFVLESSSAPQKQRFAGSLTSSFLLIKRINNHKYQWKVYTARVLLNWNFFCHCRQGLARGSYKCLVQALDTVVLFRGVVLGR